MRFAQMQVPVTAASPAPYQTRHIYNQFVIRTEKRDALQQFLRAHDIGCEVYYPVPLHLQECYRFLGYSTGAFPTSERLAAESLALPVYPELPAADLDHICDTIGAFFA